jgi:hypothetical protein
MVEMDNNSRNTTNKMDTIKQNRLFMLRNGDCSSVWDLLSLINDAGVTAQEC